MADSGARQETVVNTMQEIKDSAGDKGQPDVIAALTRADPTLVPSVIGAGQDSGGKSPAGVSGGGLAASQD